MAIMTFLAGLSMLVYGVRGLRDALQGLIGKGVRTLISRLRHGKGQYWHYGPLLSVLLQSSSASAYLFTGLANSGMLSGRRALSGLTGVGVGTGLTAMLFAFGDEPTAMVLIAFAAPIVLLFSHGPVEVVARLVFSSGLLVLGANIFGSGAHLLFSGTVIGAGEVTTLGLCFLLGLVWTLLLRSSLTVVLAVLVMSIQGIVGAEGALALFIGEGVGSSTLVMLSTLGAGARVRSVALSAMTLNWTLATLCATTLLMVDLTWLSSIGVAFCYLGLQVALLTFERLLGAPIMRYWERYMGEESGDLGENNGRHLVLFGDNLHILGVTALLQAEEELKVMHKVLMRVADLVKEFLVQEHDHDSRSQKIAKYEDVINRIQKEISLFLGPVSERPLTSEQSAQLQVIFRVADEFESIGDYFKRLVRYKHRFNYTLNLNPEQQERFFNLFDAVVEYLSFCAQGLVGSAQVDLHQCMERGQELKARLDVLRDHFLDDLEAGRMDPLGQLAFSDSIVALRRIRSHAFNVAQALERAGGTERGEDI